MCLIGLALDAHPYWPRVLVGNRDEFHDRASAALAEWPDLPGTYGGRDLVAGGSWLALRERRLVAVTNVRRMMTSAIGSPSRGWLVRDFVSSNIEPPAFLQQLRERADDHAGFNLLLGDADGMWFASNRPHWQYQRLEPGLHIVANASLDMPWRKSERLRSALAAWCDTGEREIQPLLAALADETPAEDADLPETGLPLARERMLSPVFIRGQHYGTRASTVILDDGRGQQRILEQRYAPGGVPDGRTELCLRYGASGIRESPRDPLAGP